MASLDHLCSSRISLFCANTKSDHGPQICIYIYIEENANQNAIFAFSHMNNLV